MYANNRTRRKWNQVLLFLVSCHFVKYSISSPIFSSQFSQFQSARNLRNLPCVVRKSGLKGVCMFAIDCIKTNGTHLGTCIDKFYFGSCCQVKDVDSLYNIDLDDNRIDSSFPSPSQQQTSSSSLASTISEKPYARPVSSTSPSTTTTTVQRFSSTNYKTSTKPLINYNNKTFELITTTATATKAAVSSSSPPSISTTTPSLSKRPIATRKSTTTEKYSINVGGFSTTLGNIVERNISSTIKLKDEPSTTESIKLTTFQSIQESIKNDSKSTTAKITSKPKPTKLNVSTKKPVPTTASNKTSVSSESNRRPITTIKPSRNATTTTMIRTTTRKPVPTTSSSSSSSTLAVNRRTTITSRRNSTTTRKPTPAVLTTTLKPNDGQTLTTLSYVETTKRPRPRPTTAKVEATTTIAEEDVFTTTYSVVSAGDDKKTTISKPIIMKTTTVKSPLVTRRPATKPSSIATESSSIIVSNRRPITESTIQPSSIKATTSSTSSSSTALPSTAIKIEITQKPLNWTTQKIAEEIHQTTTTSSNLSQESQQQSTNAGLITWTLGNEVVDNTTKADDAWVLLMSVTPNDAKTTPSIVDTFTESKATEATTTMATSAKLTTENIINTTQALVTNEMQKVEETTLEVGSEEESTSTDINEETSSESTSSTEEEEEDEDDEEEDEDSTTLETKPIDTNQVDENDETSQNPQSETLTTTTTRTISTTTTSSSASSSTQLSPNETLPVSIPDDDNETTVNPDSSISQETTLTSTDNDDDEKIQANETTTTQPFSTTTMNLEGVDYKQICGRRMFPEARIVGGSKASFGRWPWQISLRQWRTSTYLHKCGSALLNENWAITAAHCVENVPPSDLLLRLGEYDLSIEEEPYGYQERRVQIVASHPQFDPRTFEYDLALLRFYEPVIFQPNIIPVCVPETDEDFIGRTAYVTGWGRLYEDGPLPSVLQEVTVPVIKNDICEAMYRSAGYIEHIPHIFICAGWQKGGRDSCEGEKLTIKGKFADDSGGPMVIQRQDKRFQLAGIISWGIGCAEPNQPGVYSRISEFRDWINQILMF